MIVITHDRFFLDRVVDWMLEIFHGRAIPYKGNYSTYLEARREEHAAQEDSVERKRSKFLQNELEVDQHEPEGADRQEQGAPQELRAR